MEKFHLKSGFKPKGDQPQAIKELTRGVKEKQEHQVLLGVTGSGKTFVASKVIENLQMPTLVISHNKTLAGQLFQEFREFFPENAVHYFVSYYDYYQPEAYVPQRDLYIEKESSVNEKIETLRHSATQALMSRKDVLVVASVSCIYGLGQPKDYISLSETFKKGDQVKRREVLRSLVNLLYERNDWDLKRGGFRVRGNTVDVFPPYGERALRIEVLGGKIRRLRWIEPESASLFEEVKKEILFPAEHFITPEKRLKKAIRLIEMELEERVKELEKKGKKIEAYRLEQRTKHDLELMRELGFCPGIENYSRYLSGRKKGEPPYTLLDYFKRGLEGKERDFLCIIDESHMSIPQIRGMYAGDRARKKTLVEHGFRLPSALDNRPLRFQEFQKRVPLSIYTSATPGAWEVKKAKEAAEKHGLEPEKGVIEQIVRPTGLLDPEVEIRPLENQIEDLVQEIAKRKKRNERVLVTTLTKRMAEQLADYLSSGRKVEKLLGKKIPEIKTSYLHSEIKTLERSEVLLKLRKGEIDVIVGINLLREGLDLPEVSLVAILDADKEGFLRSETALVQTMGRAARNKAGKAILYADKKTGSIKRAVEEVERRRKKQKEFNRKHGITPETIKKSFRKGILSGRPGLKREESAGEDKWSKLPPRELRKKIIDWEKEMKKAANDLDFEKAADLRDKIRKYEKEISS